LQTHGDIDGHVCILVSPHSTTPTSTPTDILATILGEDVGVGVVECGL